ncbi:MAG: site-specific integrase [Clostridia bacterium]|nr:site-specific integrase [Clostridia bacterium]
MAKGKNGRGKDTFRRVALEWLSTKEGKVKESSLSQYKTALLERILPKIGENSIEYVTRKEYLEALKESFTNDGYSSVTVNNYLTLIRAVNLYYRGGIEGVYSSEKRSKVTVVSSTDVKKIISVAKDDVSFEEPRKLGILIILYTGLSVSELCALRWEDVDLVNRVLTVTRAVCRYRNPNPIDGEAKTIIEISDLTNQRRIPINKELAKRMSKYAKFAKEDFYVLSNSTSICEPRTMQYYMRNSFFKDFRYKYTHSEIRDTFIVTALRRGVNLYVLSDITGLRPDYLFDKYREYISFSADLALVEMNKVIY